MCTVTGVCVGVCTGIGVLVVVLSGVATEADGTPSVSIDSEGVPVGIVVMISEEGTGLFVDCGDVKSPHPERMHTTANIHATKVTFLLFWITKIHP